MSTAVAVELEEERVRVQEEQASFQGQWTEEQMKLLKQYEAKRTEQEVGQASEEAARATRGGLGKSEAEDTAMNQRQGPQRGRSEKAEQFEE